VEVAEDVKTEFRFEELSDSAKDKVRETHHHWVHADQWWDWTFEDFIRVAAIFGFSVEFDDIHFSGFWSQGDGASFKARYRSPSGSVHEALTKELYGHEELFRLANDIDVFLAPWRLLHGECYWYAQIYTSGGYCHSGTMRIDEVGLNLDDDIDVDAAETAILDVAKSLADWLYDNLEKEHDYLESDEALTELFAEHKFDEFGTMI